MKCRYCNTELKQGAKFCPNCGKEVLENDICISCGKQIKIGAKFCPHCGANQEEVIESTQQINSANAEQPQKNNDFPVLHEEVPIVTDSQEELVNTLPPYEKESRSKKWLWIIVAVLLLGVIGGYFFLNGNSMKSQPAIVDTDSIEEVVESEGTMDIHSVEGIKARLDEILKNGLHMNDEDVIYKYFSIEFRQLNNEVEKKDAQFDGPGFWDGSIWDGGQDMNPNDFTINSVKSSTETNAHAEVKLIHSYKDYHSENLMSVDLVFENDSWYIDDINGNKQRMEEYICDKGKGADFFIQVLKENAVGEGKSCEYFLFDITNDGIPELWVVSGTCEADRQLKVYSHDSKEIFNKGASHSTFHKGNDYVLQVGAHMNIAAWTKLYYDSGKVCEHVVFDEDISETGGGYTEPTDPLIELIPYDNVQPIKKAFGN